MTPQEQVAANQRRRRVNLVVQVVGREDFEIVRVFDHHRRPVAAGQIHPPGRADRRGIHIRNGLNPLGVK